MSRLSEEEIQAIMEKYRDAFMVNPDKICPSAACLERHASYPHPRANEHYRANRRHGQHLFGNALLYRLRGKAKPCRR